MTVGSFETREPKINPNIIASEASSVTNNYCANLRFLVYTVKGEIIAGLNNCVFADIWVFKH